MAEGPGADQVPSQAGDQPAGPSSERPHRHGAAPGKGNTPARTPLTPYKRWYNSNRPGKRERAAGETSRGIPLPENLRLEKADLERRGAKFLMSYTRATLFGIGQKLDFAILFNFEHVS